MTFAPAALQSLRTYLIAQIPISGAKVGIVGDTAHNAKGVSYHLGKDKLRADAYSRKTARDRAGLSNAASAIDIGNHKGLENLSNWLYQQCRANAKGTWDIRELIWAGRFAGKFGVLRYDRERGINSDPRFGEADDSHLTHTHVSFYRDSETRDKLGIFKPYYEPPQEDTVDVYSVPGVTSAEFPKGANLYRGPTGKATGTLPEARRLEVNGQDKPTSPTRYLCDGAGLDPSARCAWLDVSAATAKRDESFNAGVAAAAAAAAKARR